VRTGRQLALLAVSLVVLCSLVAGAQAQGVNSGGFLLLGIAGANPASLTTIPVTAQGQLTVTYQGDAATGCANYGLCAYRGTIVARPQVGAFVVATHRRQGVAGHRVVLAFVPGFNGYTTAALVQRSGPGGQGGTCVDAQTAAVGDLTPESVYKASVTVTPLGPGGSLLSTRCAGPLDSDLASASPTATVPLRSLERGGITINLGGSGR
jgi:hypothetical protein